VDKDNDNDKDDIALAGRVRYRQEWERKGTINGSAGFGYNGMEEKQLKAGKWFGTLVWFCCHEGRVSSRRLHASLSCGVGLFAVPPDQGYRSWRWPTDRGGIDRVQLGQQQREELKIFLRCVVQ
jgi:hypothetical protein